MSQSDEAIAKVLTDIRKGHFKPTQADEKLIMLALEIAHFPRAPIVNVTKIYRQFVDKKKSVFLYEDHDCLLLPWPYCHFAWENSFGNIYLISTLFTSNMKHKTMDFESPTGWQKIGEAKAQWKTAEPIDWSTVDHILTAVVWTGGRGKDGPKRTTGPLTLYRIAMDGDGKPLDINWIDLTRTIDDYYLSGDSMIDETANEIHVIGDKIMERVRNDTITILLESITFLTCRNVDIVAPKRARMWQRKLDRLGVNIHEITVFPVGRYSQSEKDEKQESIGIPLTTVRGHFARYGPKYGRKLLFGRLEGKFWIPSYAKGNAEHGVSIADYKLDPDGN